MTYAIVGGGIAGVTVAQELRAREANADIVVFNAERQPLYSRMLLKEFAKGAVSEDPIRIHDEAWFEARDIDYRGETRVTDVEGGTVCLDSGDSMDFDTLFATAGGSQVDPFGITQRADNAFGMWSLDETRRIKAMAESGEMGTAVVIGAGFLGLELADTLALQGVDVHFVMRGYWSRHGMGREGAEIVHRALAENGIAIDDGQSVESFETDGDRVVAVETTEQTIPCDFVGVAVGLAPNVDYLEGTDAEVADGGIVVDEHLRSADPSIYAAGDIARYYDRVLDRYNQTGTWLSAIDQGRVAAAHTLGEDDAVFSTVEGHSVAIDELEAPVVFLGDWDGGDEAVDRLYGETRYRRIAFEDDRPVGASLIGDEGDVVGQLKQIIRDGPELPDADKRALLDPYLDHREFHTTEAA